LEASIKETEANKIYPSKDLKDLAIGIITALPVIGTFYHYKGLQLIYHKMTPKISI
jgi:hypothetical protein